jgi:hypothetical protein
MTPALATAPRADAAIAAPPPADRPELSEAAIAALRRDIDHTGYAVLPQYLSVAELEALRLFVRNAVAAAGDSYTVLSGPEPVAATALGDMAASPALRHLCIRLYEIATGRPAPDVPYYQILRCLTGSTGRQHSMVFHYDSYVLTLLLPIEVPAGTDSGELIVVPNARRVRRWYGTNLIDKLLLDNPLTQRILRRLAARRERFVRIALVPGNLYAFWGYRSIHTNAPCDADKIRATALFHFGDPHRDSRLKAWLRR